MNRDEWKEMIIGEIQPYQKLLIEKLNYVTRKKIEEKAEAAFAPLRGKIEILPRNPCAEQVLSKHWEHWQTDGAHAKCLDLDCPVCQAIRERADSKDFISEEEMKL